MNLKSIILLINCYNYPCDLTISYNNKPIKCAKINSYYSKICFRTKHNRVMLKAKHNNKIIYKTIYLTNLRCQKIYVTFDFKKNIFTKRIYLIKLIDKNYRLPVSNALLNFKCIEKNIKNNSN